jgi:hypothetical protein
MQEKRKEFVEKGSEIYAKTQGCDKLIYGHPEIDRQAGRLVA